MTASDTRGKMLAFELLLLLQTLAVLVILWSMLPIYREVWEHPGHQLNYLPEPIRLVAAPILFHFVYWFRLLRVPIPAIKTNLLLSHIVPFLGRLSFIFGTSFFALLVYRHLPSLVAVTDPFDALLRFIITFGILFSLYCYSIELERLGVALRPPPKP